MIKKYQAANYSLPEYNPDADFDWIRHHSDLPWLPLDISVPVHMILEEIGRVRPLMTPHRDDYGEHQGWYSFCIHGRGFNLTLSDHHYQDTDTHYHWTAEAIQHMPGTIQYFKTQWPADQYRRLRVMLLAPGGYITLHSDGTGPALTPINIAITQPDECHFVVEHCGTVPFRPGAAMWMNVHNRHAVENRSASDRWHLIVHQNLDCPEFQSLVMRSYHLLYHKF